MQPKSARRAVLLALLVAVFAVVAAWRFWPSGTGTAAPTPANGQEKAYRQPVRLPLTAEAAAQTSPEAGPTTNDVDTDPVYRRLRFATRDTAGASVGNVLLRIRPPEAQSGGADAVFATGPEGYLDLEVEPSVTRLRVSVDDPIWHGKGTTHSIDSWPDVLVVTVDRLVSVSFAVQYEDGEPFTGRVGIVGGGGRPVRERNDDIRAGSTESSGFTMTQSPYTVDDIQSCDTTFRFTTSRPGYLNHSHTVSASEMVDGALIQVVIPKTG